MQDRAGGTELPGCHPQSWRTVQLLGPGPQHQGLNSCMTPHAEADAISAAEIVRQQRLQLIQGMGHVGPEGLHCPLGAPAEPLPHLSCGVLGRDEQHKRGLRPVWQKQGHCARFIKTGQVPEIAVLTEGELHIGVVLHRLGRWNHSGLALKGVYEQLSPGGVGDRHGV